MTRRFTGIAAAILMVVTSSELATARTLTTPQTVDCDPTWVPTFGSEPGANARVNDMIEFDDGNGEAIYMCGSFTSVEGVAANRIARWDGATWTPLGEGFDDRVISLAVFDDGSGPALFAGGFFTSTGSVPMNGIAKWDGTSWSALGSGITVLGGFAWANCMQVHDDGSGPALFVGGRFDFAGGVPTFGVAKWDGSTWTSLATNGVGAVSSFVEFDDGSGNALYAGGSFLQTNGAIADSIAKWDGSTWSAVGNGLSREPDELLIFDDGTGEAIFAGGSFTSSGGSPIGRIAKWDGANWQSPNGGFSEGSIHAMAVHDDGTGETLYVGGIGLEVEGENISPSVARWTGSDWESAGIALDGFVRSLASLDIGSGPELYVGGSFRAQFGFPANYIARWDGTNWAALNCGLNNPVRSLAVFDDGTGDALYVGGEFVQVGEDSASAIARWDGGQFRRVGNGAAFLVFALEVFDLHGFGPALYAGGLFQNLGADPEADNLARWDGSNWSAVGGGHQGRISAMEEFDDGSGSALYIGGTIWAAGGAPVNRIAGWDGTTWSALGTGVDGTVWALQTYDDGSGSALFVGGGFTTAGGIPVNYIARWDGANWSAVGAGMIDTVRAMTVYDDGTGPALFVGCDLPNGGPTNRVIAKWNGTTWQALGMGVNGDVDALFVHDDGGGSALYVGGEFTLAGNQPVNNLARWDGSSWSAVGTGTNSGVLAFAELDDGVAPSLIVGGSFTSTFETNDSYVAKWRCPLPSGNNLCAGDGGNQSGCTDCPCGNNASQGTVGGCLNSQAVAGRLHVSGSPAVNLPHGSTHDLRFSVSDVAPTAFCVLNSGDALAPSNPANPCFGLSSGLPAASYDGLRCAVLNTRRHGGRAADAQGELGVTNNPWGGEGTPPAGIAQSGGMFMAGQTRYFQVIYRDDPLTVCMRGLNTTQAVSVRFTIDC